MSDATIPRARMRDLPCLGRFRTGFTAATAAQPVRPLRALIPSSMLLASATA